VITGIIGAIGLKQSLSIKKAGILAYGNTEVQAGYSSAPGVDLDSRISADLFFLIADGWLPKVNNIYGGQYSVLCYHYLWQYSVPVSGILSERQVHLVWPAGVPAADRYRDIAGLCYPGPLSAFFNIETHIYQPADAA
jgi:hypothetical protein